jgi:hypothetical protein
MKAEFLIIFLVLLFPMVTHSVFAGEESCPEGSNVYQNGFITISPLRGCSDISQSNPVFYYGDDLTITFNGDEFCNPGKAVSVRLLESSFSDSDAFGFGNEETIGVLAIPGFLTFFQPAYAAVPSLPAFMTEIGNTGIFSITVNLFPQHGAGQLQFDVTCEDSNLSGVTSGPPIFLDPSGTVIDACTNQPIQGATVTLFDNIGNPGNEATQESDETASPPIMDPQINPQTTPADGTYAWLVLPSPDSNGDGFNDIPQILWKVQASAPGYVTQSAPVGNGFPIPPEVVGLDFFLDPVNACPDIIGGEIIPIESTALLLAGAQTSAFWILPIILVGVGLVAFRKMRS